MNILNHLDLNEIESYKVIFIKKGNQKEKARSQLFFYIQVRVCEGVGMDSE